jgi:hypothetical protein
MVVRANGRHQIPFEMLLVGKEADWKAKDSARLASMKNKYEASLMDIVKAITGGATWPDSVVHELLATLFQRVCLQSEL